MDSEHITAEELERRRAIYRERFVDDSAFLPVGTPMPPPHFARGLIVQLRLDDASREEREDAIAQWLRENEPSDCLRRSLQRNGYGHLLAPTAEG
jgi:hypothetical protein